MSYNKINNVIITMGKDPYDPELVAGRVKTDKEIYLDAFNKYDFSINGKKVGRMYLEELDKSKKLPDDIIVIGTREVEEALPGYTDGLEKNYHFVIQGKNRFDNIKKVKGDLLPGTTYVSGADLPQVTSIDERIDEHIEKFGELKTANILLGEIESLGHFWRNPFFLYIDMQLFDELHNHTRVISGNQGYKEPQDYILDIGKIDFDKIEKFNPSTKMDSRSARLKMKTKLAAFAIRYGGIMPSIAMIKEFQKINNTYNEFKGNGLNYDYPVTHSGNPSIIERFAEKVFKLEHGEIRMYNSKNAAFYQDVDSAEDLVRHLRIIAFNNFALPNVGSANELIRYNGTPLFELPEIRMHINDSDEFFKNIRAKEIAMDKFSFDSKSLNLERLVV